MKDYTKQIQRIKDKLLQARKVDKAYKVFGAKSHKYILNQPATEADVIAIEEKYDIQLPEAYKAFVTCLGNGGVGHSNSGAGPYYGIYALGNNVDELIYNETENYLKNGCVIYPKMTDEFWNNLNKAIDEDETISDESYERELGKIFAGILPIGSQGCSYIHGIVLNGQYKGQVVNLDTERQKPIFTFEANFLDWYERWLDEVISGKLLKNGPSWFGYSIGGTENRLLSDLISSSSVEDKNENLNGLLAKKSLSAQAVDQIEQLLNSAFQPKQPLIQLLCKTDYKKAKPFLIELAETDLGAVVKFVFWYTKNKGKEWIKTIERSAYKIDDHETFRFCLYLLKETNIDIGEFVRPFTRNNHEDIRTEAFYALREISNKSNFIECFLDGLQDESSRVVSATLQALSKVKDDRLLIYYRKIAERFPVERDYVLANLNHRLEEYGLTNQTILTKDIGLLSDKLAKKWYEVWK